MVAAVLDSRALQESVRTSRDLGAVVASVRQIRSLVESDLSQALEAELDALVRDFARPVLDEPDATAAMLQARKLAPSFLISAIRTTAALVRDQTFSQTVQLGLPKQVEAASKPLSSPAVRFAAACCRDALFLWSGVGPWVQHARFDDTDALTEFVAEAAVSDLLLFVALVGLADGDFERRPELTDLARHAWDQVVRRYWATLQLVRDHVDEGILRQFLEINWRRGLARRDRIVESGARLTVSRDAFEYWGDELVGGYLERALQQTLQSFPGARLELEIAEEPETDDEGLALRIHVSGLTTAEAVDAERRVMQAIAATLPDCLVGALVVDLRLE